MLTANQKRVWKSELLGWEKGEVIAKLPVEAAIIHVAMQTGTPTLWYEFKAPDGIPAVKYERHLFRIYGTGHIIDDNDVYVGTCFDAGFVWHVYESNSPAALLAASASSP